MSDCFDPIGFQKDLWPQVSLYDKEVECVLSVRDSVETYVVASNKAGKDFIAGYICVSFMLAPWLYFPKEYVRQVQREGKGHSRRIVTTSIAGDHLRVLWAEIGWWLTNARTPLLKDRGGPLYLTEMELRFASDMHLKTPSSYCIGIVYDKPEKLAGHHAPYTLGVGDEASGLEDAVYTQFQGWAKRQFHFGNPNDCANFWRRNYELGDLKAEAE